MRTQVSEPVVDVISGGAETAERCARAQGWSGDDYALTREDCDLIVDEILSAFGRKPTRAEWHAAGYRYVGNRHYEG